MWHNLKVVLYTYGETLSSLIGWDFYKNYASTKTLINSINFSFLIAFPFLRTIYMFFSTSAWQNLNLTFVPLYVTFCHKLSGWSWCNIFSNFSANFSIINSSIRILCLVFGIDNHFDLRFNVPLNRKNLYIRERHFSLYRLYGQLLEFISGIISFVFMYRFSCL